MEIIFFKLRNIFIFLSHKNSLLIIGNSKIVTYSWQWCEIYAIPSALAPTVATYIVKLIIFEKLGNTVIKAFVYENLIRDWNWEILDTKNHSLKFEIQVLN